VRGATRLRSRGERALHRGAKLTREIKWPQVKRDVVSTKRYRERDREREREELCEGERERVRSLSRDRLFIAAYVRAYSLDIRQIRGGRQIGAATDRGGAGDRSMKIRAK
jgi:hypothetical protein